MVQTLLFAYNYPFIMQSRALSFLSLLLLAPAGCNEDTPTSCGDCAVASWRQLDGGLGENHFDAVWANAPDTVIALGADHPVYRFDGTTWSASPQPEGSFEFLSMWASSPRNVYAVGRHGVAFHFDGASWTQLDPGFTGDLTDVWGLPTGEVFVGAVDLDVTKMLQLSGGVWTEVRDSLPAGPRAVWASGARNLYVAGDGGFIARYDGRFWVSIREFDYTGAWRDAWGASATTVFFVGDGGGVAQYQSPVFTQMPSPTSNNLLAVHGFSADDVWAVGDAGTIVHFDGTSWSVAESGTTSDLRAIWTYNGGAVAAGYDGTVLFYDGSRWDEPLHGRPVAYRDMYGFSAQEVFAVGRAYGGNGFVRHLDGREWSLPGPELLAVWGFTPDDVYAVGVFGAAFHFDGSSWSPMASGTVAHLNGVWGARDGEVRRVYAVGERGTIRAWDGTKWTPMVPPPQFLSELRDVWAAAPDDAFAVGERNRVLRFRGPMGTLNWTGEEIVSGPVDFNAIVGRDGVDVIAVSDDGRAFHYAGQAWDEIALAGAGGAPLVDVSLAPRRMGAIVAAPHRLALLEGRMFTWIEIPFLGTIETGWTSGSVTYVAGRQGAIFEYR